MDLDTQIDEAMTQIGSAPTLEAPDAQRVALLGKSGLVTEQLKALGKLPAEQRKAHGEHVNRTKERLQAAIAERKRVLENAAFDKRLAEERVDVTLPGRNSAVGSIHPVTRALERIVE